MSAIGPWWCIPSTAGAPMTGYKVGYFVGSLASKSINRLLAKALAKLAPPELQMTEISFKDLPLYSYDYDANYPPVATEFKDAIAAVDAVLFVTPEYNRSIPGGLKNAIDWASRPYGTNAFARRRRPSLSGRRRILDPLRRSSMRMCADGGDMQALARWSVLVLVMAALLGGPIGLRADDPVASPESV